VSKRKTKAKKVVIECPGWCTRGQEHTGPDDHEHWTDETPVGVSGTSVSAVQDQGAVIYEVRLSDHAKLQLMHDDVADLISALALVLSETHRTWTKRVELVD
jgi:hypothetical protein